jgi:hypothetical protein
MRQRRSTISRRRAAGRPLAAAVVGFVLLLVWGGAALAANRYSIGRLGVSPVGVGSAERPAAVGARFALETGEDDPGLRPAPVVSYALAAEGIVAFPRSFAGCSLRRLSRRRGVPAACERARVGRGLVKGAAGLAEDRTLEASSPCNLRLGVYNTGRGLALRLDGQPPIPAGFRTNRIGCPVPVHLAIPMRIVAMTIDGVRASELRFRLPDLLLEPLDGWDATLRTVDVTLDRKRARGGRGLLSAVGCAGGRRTMRVVYTEQQGPRAEATREIAC